MKPSSSPYIRDITPPPPDTDSAAEAEIVSDIPVEIQKGTEPGNNPITNPVPALTQGQSPSDQEFNNILKDMNLEVSKTTPEAASKKPSLSTKNSKTPPGPQNAKPRSSQIIPVVLALAAALVLAFAAFVAFNKSSGL